MTASTCRSLLLAWSLLAGAAPTPATDDEPLLTVAEKSNWKATSRHQDVVDFCQALAKRSPLVRLGELGTSREGRSLPMLILADPPVANAREAAVSGKLVFYAQGNIHAGEVDGKEGLMMLARELATGPERALLKDVIIVLVPIFNADGNERMSRTNRPGQVGPEEGMGIRENADGYDLNRDFVKLETPEVRALVRFCNAWDPAVVIDCHTTNGSYHRYTLTYEGPRVPAGSEDVITFVRDKLFPDVGRRLKQRDGFESFFYGNFSRDRTRWETVPPTPRYGTLYVGLRNRIGILSESYSYASYKDRIIASRDFVRSILEFTSQNKHAVRKLLEDVQADTVRSGNTPRNNDRVPLRTKPAPVGGPVKLLGYVEEMRGGRRPVPTERKKEYELTYWGGAEPTVSVARPFAYLIPASAGRALDTLARHGVLVGELSEETEVPVETYRVDKVTRAPRMFQKHRTIDQVDVTSRREARRVPAGTRVVRTGQPLGDLIVYFLEPQSEDGLSTWNCFDDELKEGTDFPVLRVPTPAMLPTK